MLVATFNRPNITYEIRYKRLLQDGEVDADMVKFLASRKEECGIICEPVFPLALLPGVGRDVCMQVRPTCSSGRSCVRVRSS